MSATRARRPWSVVAAALLLASTLAATSIASAQDATAPATPAPTRVEVETSLGRFVIQLETERAPLSVANFLQYVRDGHYDGTVFHRVIQNFVAQGGGFGTDFKPRPARAGIPNESGNGISNRRGTVGLARAEAPHSGSAQFYVNLADNEDLDPSPLRWGYAVFGRVVEGLEVVDRIAHVPTGEAGPWAQDSPLQPVVIRRVAVVGAVAAPAAQPAAQPETPTTSASGIDAAGRPAGSG